MSNIELAILDFIRNNLTHPFLDWVMKLITFLGDGGLLWIALGVALLFFKRTRKMGLTVCLALLLNLILCNITLKPLIARTRPFDLAESVELIISKPTGFSFPSGHTSSSFAAAFAVLLHNKRYGTFAMIFAFIIAISRLYLYVHFPTDILAGAIVGMLCAVASYYTFKTIFKKAEN